MKFSVAAVLGAVVAVQAGGYSNVSYTTEVVTAYTTYCPYATTLTNNGQTITVTEATTVTFTNCPCTITKPVSTYSPPSNTTVPAPPPPPPASTTKAAATTVATLPTAGAGKAAALSGAGLAGVLGLAAFAL